MPGRKARHATRGCAPGVTGRPGREARRDNEYERRGTANVFCAVEPKAGRHFTKVTPTRSSAEFADYLRKIAVRYPAADTIHLVMDNLSTHTPKALVERFGDTAETLVVAPIHRSTTPPNMEVDCIKRRWRPVCSAAGASANDESEISQPCGNRLTHGTAASIRTRFDSVEVHMSDRPEKHFTTQSRGQSTSRNASDVSEK